jgi:RNA 2',3'-cyclic 3'-phosphodiesterase
MARTRTFISVELSKPIRDRIVALQDELARAGTDVKWTEPENIHVTLLFLGEVPNEELPEICRVVSETLQDSGPFALSVQGAGCFPNVRRPRIVWVGVGTGTQELVRIHDDLEEPLFHLGFRKEDRKYTPHITLGRVRSDRPTEKLSAALQQHAGWQAGEMHVNEIHVMGSELTRDGPVYTVLGRGKLGKKPNEK